MLAKKLLLILTVLLFTFALAACGADESSETPDTDTESAVVDEPTEEPAVVEATEVPAVAEPTEAPVEVVALSGDPILGGLLYDKWWVMTRADAPEEDHPLWGTQDSNARHGADSWRCKECHGWDYKGADGAYSDGSHFTGFTGIFHLAGTNANEILGMMQGTTNPDHDFSTVMDEQALIDLALFISEDMLDSAQYVGDDKVALSSEVAAGTDLFQDTCTECHGPEGLAVNFGKIVSDIDYVSGIANGNPYEFIHKVRFGQPGTAMTAVLDSDWTVEEQAALLAYAQTLPNVNLATQGGQLYDKWWVAFGVEEPTGEQPLWATQDTNERSGKDSWRCKECHGWDYQGVDGAYGGGSHMTGFAGVLNAASQSVDELIAWLNGTTNADHDFSAFLDEAAMEMLAVFIQENSIDMTPYINEDKTVNGDADHGNSLYNQGCARCHGNDGQALNFGSDDDPVYLADVALDNPWETLHKAANGQPGEDMTSGLNMGWSWQDLADLVAHLQTLGE